MIYFCILFSYMNATMYKGSVVTTEKDLAAVAVDAEKMKISFVKA